MYVFFVPYPATHNQVAKKEDITLTGQDSA